MKEPPIVTKINYLYTFALYSFLVPFYKSQKKGQKIGITKIRQEKILGRTKSRQYKSRQ